MSNYNPVGWFEMYVQDIDRAQKFYETVLQVQMQDMSDPTEESMKMVGFPMSDTEECRAAGASGALVQMQGVQPGGNSTLIYFTSIDCTTEESRVTAAGGRVFKPKMPIGEYGFISLCFDTEGNMFGLHSMQ